MSQNVTLSAAALDTRIDQGLGAPLTLDEASEAVTQAVQGKGRAELIELLAYQTCQVAGLRNSLDQDARLAMSNIERIVRDYSQRRTP